MRTLHSATTLAALLLAAATLPAVPATAQPTVRHCAGHRATIVGTPGADVIQGTSHRDVVVARGGRDRIHGLGGNDLICAGTGRDAVHAGRGNDRVLGGRGVDVLAGGRDDDRVSAGPRPHRGRDVLVADQGRDVLRGHAVSTLVSYARATDGVMIDLARGRASGPGVGADRIVGPRAVMGSPSSDVLLGSPRVDLLVDRGGNDQVFGRGGADVLYGLQGADVLRGGKGRDVVVSRARDDVAGGARRDLLLARGGAIVRGGGGPDLLVALFGAPVLDGGAGRDTVGLRSAGGPVRVDLRRGTADSRAVHAAVRRVEVALRGQRLGRTVHRVLERHVRLLHRAGPPGATMQWLARWAAER